MCDIKLLLIQDNKMLIFRIFMLILILCIFFRIYRLARPIDKRGCAQWCESPTRYSPYFSLYCFRVAKFLFLDVFSQIYMGRFLIVFPGSSTRREHFSTAKALVLTPYTRLNRELHVEVSPIGSLA